MTRPQAINLYLAKYRFSHVIINRLMQWNPKLSIRENSVAMKVNYEVLQAFQRRFKLPYKYVGRGNNFRGLKND
jgi:hypothetical protein